MFIGSGLFFLVWAYAHYQMGTAVRMGPAYFPVVLGGLLAVLGLLVFIEGFALESSGEPLQLPFSFLDLVIAVAIFVVVIYLATTVGISSDYGMLAASVVVSVLTVLYRPNAKALVLISVGCVALRLPDEAARPGRRHRGAGLHQRASAATSSSGRKYHPLRHPDGVLVRWCS